jgi:hypothetical protein
VYFITESYSYASGDGRVILRACIDRPANFDHKAFEYLNLYSNALLQFAREKLFLRAMDLYIDSINSNMRFVPLLYSLKYIITYSDDTYLSCVMCVKLLQGANVLEHKIDSVVFYNDKILPSELICRKHKKNKILLDLEGFPCIVNISEGKPIFQRVGKKSLKK